jgi:hypothetical protein
MAGECLKVGCIWWIGYEVNGTVNFPVSAYFVKYLAPIVTTTTLMKRWISVGEKKINMAKISTSVMTVSNRIVFRENVFPLVMNNNSNPFRLPNDTPNISPYNTA